MVLHNINFKLTTEQVAHLNEALKEHYDCNIDAMESSSFESQYPALKKQCDALQILIHSIKNIVSEVEHAQ